MSQLDGIGRRMPITMTAFTIGALSMIGLPPAAGLVSKTFLVETAAEGAYYAVLGVLFVSALLNAGYFLPIVWRGFFRPPGDPESGAFNRPESAFERERQRRKTKLINKGASA